jgi:polysaccharide pyruvyl transferase WcaK-like protein
VNDSAKSGTGGYTRVILWDTSVGSENLGDEIIMDSVDRVAREVFPSAHVLRLPTHLPVGYAGKRLLRDADAAIVGGTNLLSSHMLRYRQWKIDPIDATLMRRTSLLGVGWWQYQQQPDVYTRRLLRSALDPNMIHAVRDDYTAANLKKAGIDQVLNTGCPTLWHVDQEPLAQAARERSDTAVCTVTDYRPDLARDTLMLDGIRRHFAKRYLWLQGTGDHGYIQNLDLSGFEIIDPNLRSFDEVLARPCEFFGTRLHAGIRAMQFGRYTRIVAVDNRAAEMGKDFGLPVISDLSAESVERAFVTDRQISLRLPFEAIAKWRAQFASFGN